MRPVTTSEIRSALLQMLSARDGGSPILEEFTCESGRVDVLTTNQMLHGFEIKSDYDSLARVSFQITSYSRYCDALTFVAGPRLALKLLASVPVWCGVILAHRGAPGISLVALRTPKNNPRVDAQTSLSLLGTAELRAIARRESQARPRTKKDAVRLLASIVPFETIRDELSESLRRRASAAAGESLG